jgi:hypothetical protein
MAIGRVPDEPGWETTTDGLAMAMLLLENLELCGSSLPVKPGPD